MGNVKLNIGGGGGVAETLPTVLASCSAASGNAKADISWEYANTDYLKGIRICYKTGAYPENAEDGAYVDIEGAETLSATITGIENNVAYYFRLFPYNENGDYQASVTNALCSTTPFSFAIIAGTATVETGVTDDGTTGYAIISSSGTFTTVGSPSGGIDVYLVGGGASGSKGSSSTGTTTGGWSATTSTGGSGGVGGYVYQTTLPSSDGTIEYTATIGAAGSTAGTTLVCEDETLKCSSGTRNAGGSYASIYINNDTGTVQTVYKNATEGIDGILVPGYGYVGSSGGGGGPSYKGVYYGKSGGEGAGDGAGSVSNTTNKGTAATNYGCGGGGGGEGSTSPYAPGSGMQGCIILNWKL